MFSMEKCLGRNGNGTPGESELYTAGDGQGKEGAPSDEVASAVAAVSDEIGDILKDELGDADKADRIGAELADLSAELGLLAGLTDGESQEGFPSLFEIAMGHRGSGSGSSSSSWSGGRGGRPRRQSRPQRAPRRRAIAKGKEMSRRRSAAARRAVCVRVRRVEVVSDASDVGADSDSDDQWTELDDASGTSDSSSTKEMVAVVATDCNGYQHKSSEHVEPPAMGQFLLPLLSADSAAPDPEHFLIRHEDILQLLASAEECARDDTLPLDDNVILDTSSEMLSGVEVLDPEETFTTTEDEATVLHYICEAVRDIDEYESKRYEFEPVPEWLLGVFHSWCEISALMFTLIGTNMSVELVREEWVYRARFPCHCRLCVCLANNADTVAQLVRDCVSELARCGSTMSAAAGLVRALRLDGGPIRYREWDIPRLRRALTPSLGASIIHEQLNRLAQQNEIAEQIVNNVCLCKQFDKPLEKQYAIERFCNILENFKAASTIMFKVEMVPVNGSGSEDGSSPWLESARARLARYLRPHQRASTSARLRDMADRTTPHDLNAWAGYKHRCDCSTPRTLSAHQRRQLLRISFFGMMQAVNEFNGAKTESVSSDKPSNAVECEKGGTELQQGDGTGAKPPDSVQETQPPNELAPAADDSDSNRTCDLDDLSESEANSRSGSLGLSTSSSLDSASELLLAAAAAVESADGASEGEAAPAELCRTVRHLMRSIASIERLMDRVLRHCDEWPAPPAPRDTDARKRVDMGLSEVDRKLMAMYRRLPEVHRRQLQVYRKQKKLSTVCMQLVGGRAPAPPPPGSPPPAPPHQPCRALCPEYHLQRFKEVRRKVMHMRDQQLYYHRLRMWLENQLRHERESLPESNVTLIEDLPRRKRRSSSPKVACLTAAPKRKIKSVTPISKPHKILQLLRHRAPAQTAELLTDDVKSEVDPPEAFPLEREDNISDTETIVGEKESGELCKDMKECLAKFSNFELNDSLQEEYPQNQTTKYPESVSPPLQEMSPTTPDQVPFVPKPSQRLLTVNKYTKDDNTDIQAPEVLNIPLNARKTPPKDADENDKDPNIYKYVSFGLEIKKAMEECQNIISSYKDGKKEEIDGQLSLEQICEVMMTLDKNSVEFLDKIDTEEPIDMAASTKLAELVENMPQILANMPEIASKLSEFANASFELPEFASIMNSLPEVNNEAQLTPETLKQIRDLKLNKIRDNIKVTKNTTKRKTLRKTKSNIDTDIISTMTFEFDNKDLADLLKDEKELQLLMKNKSNKEDFKDLLFSISAQVVINKVFEYLKQNKSPELAKCLEEDRELFSLPKNSINSEMYSKASTLFDNSVKDALSMNELRELVKSRFNSWKHYVSTKFKSIPLELLENEIESMLDKFYSYIQDLASKQTTNDTDKVIQKLDELRKVDESADAKDKTLSGNTGTLDLLITKFSQMTPDKKESVKSLKFKYLNVLKRCTESQQLTVWILNDPDAAVNVIHEIIDIPVKKTESTPDLTTASIDKKKEYFIERIRELNRLYMDTLPKKSLSGDDWLVMLYKLEQYEEKLKDTFNKYTPPIRTNASEAEILAAKGLSKIIGKANVKFVKKAEPEKPKVEPKKVDSENSCHNDALLAKCEAILTSKGEKTLLDSFYTIKSYITQGLPVPETYKKHVISICSNIDAKLLDEDVEDSKSDEKDLESKEDLAKYSAQALKNAKQTLNAVAFKSISRNSKSESDACDTPKTDCKWTNDCICKSCKDKSSMCLGDLVKQCYMETNMSGEEKKKEKKPALKPKPVAKACENGTHQQHVCKVGHAGGGGCAGEPGAEQPCTCCYCTVFGHAPPLTTPVPRNFNETRERLRSILNKKKQLCKTINGEGEAQEKKQIGVQTPPVESPHQKPPQVAPHQKPPQVAPHQKPPQVAPRPPALPKTQPPSLTPSQVQQKRQSIDNQRQLADKMAKMAVSDKPADNKPKPQHRTVPVQANLPPALKAEGKVNPNAMEQIRLQQLKQQQQAQYQQQLQQQQQQAAAQQQQQKKPEPIYDLPIHNKPTLTLQQQQQIRQQQQQLQQQQQQQLQQQQQQQQQHQQQHQQQQQQAAAAQQQQQQQQQQAVAAAQQQAAQQQQRQSRPQQQRSTMSLSSRDTSVFSTSSGCSGGSSWRGSRPEDTRDLDALLQYIEGPTRHVDRGKKRAKKQRQKAKRLEVRLVEERERLAAEYARRRAEVDALQVTHAAAQRRAHCTAQILDNYQRAKKKGKKQKMSSSQQAQFQMVTEQLGELTSLMNTTAKEIQAAEKQAAEYARRLRSCERQLAEVRSQQPATNSYQHHLEQAAMLHKQQQFQQQQLLQHQQLEQQRQMHLQELDKQNNENQKQTPPNARINIREYQKDLPSSGGIVCVRRSPGDGAVTVSIPGQNSETPLARVLQTNRSDNVQQMADESKADSKQSESQRKQTWEQALAHINQLANGSTKDKKKQKDAKQTKAEQRATKKEQQRSNSLPETQTLSKKQRKLLAKQQAEEEEKKKQQELKEAQSKKADTKKVEAQKNEASTKKSDKKQAVKKQEPVQKEEKKEKKEKKGKENKQEKTNAHPPTKQTKQPAQQQQQSQLQSQQQPNNKKEKKQQQQQQQQPQQQQQQPQQQQQQPKAQVVNITPDTTIEVVSKKNPCSTEAEKPSSCSIMEQLSCGVQVADLRLPPGITLTRVQPCDKKDPPPIKSVPAWKCNQLPAAPTPVARPPPVINAEPALAAFSPAHPPEPLKQTIPEPQPVGKSKKAKKKAKKAAATAADVDKQDGTKMVTLRNPMFHPNLPPVQVTAPPAKTSEHIRIPDPIPMPPNACQATITPTSNGMYTIRNPLMSIMHQQSMIGIRNQNPQIFPQQYNYVNPNTYPTYTERTSPKQEDLQTRIMNLASFTQKNDEGYSLFKTSEDTQQKSFLTPEYFTENQSPNVVSPNPIGTRPTDRCFDSNESLFANTIQRPEPIGTKKDMTEFTGLYTPFGQEGRNVFGSALFSDKSDSCSSAKVEENVMNGDSLPYFQRLRAGSMLNNEVTIHHVTESKFYKSPEGYATESGHMPAESGHFTGIEDSLFSRPAAVPAWPDQLYANSATTEPSVFLPNPNIKNLSMLEVSEGEIECCKRFDFCFQPPQN